MSRCPVFGALPAAAKCGGFEGVSCGEDVATVWAGEEIQILGRARGELLGGQGGATGEEEALAGRQAEEHLCYFDLESGQPFGYAGRLSHRYAAATRVSLMSDAQAVRMSRGMTRSSHRSISSAPSR